MATARIPRPSLDRFTNWSSTTMMAIAPTMTKMSTFVTA